MVFIGFQREILSIAGVSKASTTPSWCLGVFGDRLIVLFETQNFGFFGRTFLLTRETTETLGSWCSSQSAPKRNIKKDCVFVIGTPQRQWIKHHKTTSDSSNTKNKQINHKATYPDVQTPTEEVYIHSQAATYACGTSRRSAPGLGALPNGGCKPTRGWREKALFMFFCVLTLGRVVFFEPYDMDESIGINMCFIESLED